MIIFTKYNIEKTVWLTLQMLIYYFGWKKLQKWAKSKKSIFWSNRPHGWSRVVMAYFYVRTSSSVVRGGRGWSFSGHLKKIHFLVICPPRWTGVVCRQNEKRARVIHPRIICATDRIRKSVHLTLTHVAKIWPKSTKKTQRKHFLVYFFTIFVCSFDQFDELYRSVKTVFEFEGGRTKRVL